MRRPIFIVLIVAGVCAAGSAMLWRGCSRAPVISVLPVGQVASTNGSGAYMVGLTNNSRNAIECYVCRDTVGRSFVKRVVLSPASGALVDLPLRGVQPWTLNVWYQRSPGRIEHLLRRIGARLRICGRAPARERVTSVEVAQ